jgi:hypothetical protein
MKTSIRILRLLIILIAMILAGCTGTPIQVGTGTQQQNLETIDFSQGRHLTAEASGFQLLLFIPIGINSRHEGAYSKLLAKAGGDYLTDVKIKESWIYALVGTVYITTIEATAYPKKSNGS